MALLKSWSTKVYSGGCLVDTVCDASSRNSSANLIRHILPNIGGSRDVVVVSADVVTHMSLRAQLLVHEINGAGVTMLLGCNGGKDAKSSGGKETQPTEYLGIQDDNVVAIYSRAHEKMRDVKVSEACLSKYRSLNIRSDLSDMRLYVFNYDSLKSTLTSNPALLDLQKHVIPYMVRYQLLGSQHGASVPTLERSSSTNLTLSGSNSHATISGSQAAGIFDTEGSKTANRNSVIAYYIGDDTYCKRVSCIGDYGEVNRDVASPDMAKQFLSEKPNARGDAIIGDDLTRGNKITIGGGSVVGCSCVLGDKCSIKRSVIGNFCKLGAGVKIINSVIQDKVVLGDGCHIQNSVICAGATLTNKVSAKDCTIGPSTDLDEPGDYKSEDIFAE